MATKPPTSFASENNSSFIHFKPRDAIRTLPNLTCVSDKRDPRRQKGSVIGATFQMAESSNVVNPNTQGLFYRKRYNLQFTRNGLYKLSFFLILSRSLGFTMLTLLLILETMEKKCKTKKMDTSSNHVPHSQE